MGSEFRSIVQPTAKELQFEEIIWHNFERKTMNGTIGKV